MKIDKAIAQMLKKPENGKIMLQASFDLVLVDVTLDAVKVLLFVIIHPSVLLN